MMGVDGNWGAGVGPLMDALITVGMAYPTARLMANALGNLQVWVPDETGTDGEIVGFVTVGNARVGGVSVHFPDAGNPSAGS